MSERSTPPEGAVVIWELDRDADGKAAAYQVLIRGVGAIAIFEGREAYATAWKRARQVAYEREGLTGTVWFFSADGTYVRKKLAPEAPPRPE